MKEVNVLMLNRFLIGLMVLTLCLFSVPALSADFGVGYTLQTEAVTDLGDIDDADYFHGLSGRAWFDNLGLEANLFINQNETDAFGFKGMYAPLVRDNFKGYLGAAGMYYDLDNRNDDNVLGFGPLLGVEFMVAESLGINFDAAWYFVSDGDKAKTNLGVEELSFGLGVHYYF